MYAVLIQRKDGANFLAHGPKNTMAVYHSFRHAAEMASMIRKHKMKARVVLCKITFQERVQARKTSP